MPSSQIFAVVPKKVSFPISNETGISTLILSEFLLSSCNPNPSGCIYHPGNRVFFFLDLETSIFQDYL